MLIPLKPKEKYLSATAIILALLLAAILFWKKGIYPFTNSTFHERLPNKMMLQAAEKLVKVNVSPPFNFSFDIMTPGVLQHLDRRYTYDVIPSTLLNGLLFQGIHRVQKGTVIKYELKSPATISFFFHHTVDGGYSDIFAKLKNWDRSTVAPQYDIYNGDHGLKMVMYQMEADAGTYILPPTTKGRACFSIVFQANE